MQITGGLTITGGAINFNANDPNFNYVSLLTSTTGANTATANTFIDGSANSFAMTRVGNVAQGSFSPYGQTWSNYFDGTGDYLKSASSSVFAFGANDFTMEAWVFPITVAGTQGVVSTRISLSGGAGQSFFGIDAGKLLYFASSAIQSTASISAGQWSHIAATRSGTTIRVFLNGVQVATGTDGESKTTTFGYVAAGGGDNSQLFTGYVADARIINGTALYTANFTPPMGPLTATANTALLTCQSNRFVDNSPNNLAITRNGDVRITKESPYEPITSYAYGPYGDSVYFDGTGDYLTYPAGAATAFGTGDFTVEVWIYSIGTSNYYYLHDNRNASQTTNWAFYLTSGNQIEWYTGSTFITGSGGTVTAKTWNHVAYTRSGTTGRLFLNGVQVGTGTDSTNYSVSSSTSYIGSRYSLTEQFYGYMSNFRILKGTALYTANFTPPTEQLTAVTNTSLLTCQGSPIVDNSNNRFSITVNGNTKVIASSPFTNFASLYDPGKIGGSAYFNGTTDYLATTGSAVTVGASNFTFECWAYATTVSQLQFMLSAGSTSQWALGIAAANVMSYRPATGTSGEILGTTTITANTWNHYAVVREGGNANETKIYLNGKLEGIGQTSSSFSAVAIQIGTGRGAPTNLFNGYISDARLANAAIYTANFSVPAGPLTTVTSPTRANTWTLLSSTNSGIFDSAGKNNLLTYGGAKVATNVTKFGTGSIALIAATDYLIPTESLPYAFGSGDFTIEMWVNLNAYPSTYGVFYDARPSGGNGAYAAIYMDPTNLYYYVNTTNAITAALSTIGTGTWRHLAVSRSGSSTKMFVDGVQVGSTYTDTTVYLNPTQRPVIGGGGNAVGAYPMNGYLEDLRVTKGIARYTANFTPPTQPFPRC